MSIEEDCPPCGGSSSANEMFAVAKVAEHIKEKARHDDQHQNWIDEHTENGTLAEIRTALSEHNHPHQSG